MIKAFIFDVDGVIIDTESQWEVAKKKLFSELFGEKISQKLGLTVGMSIDDIYEKAIALGASVSKDEFRDRFFSHAPEIYNLAPITDGIDELANFLIENGFTIGAVSASPKLWVDIAIGRLSFKDKFKLVLSLDDRPDLSHKPAPDGYLEAIRELGSTPEQTTILEDSEAGIQSAKAAGAYTIGFSGNLVEGQTQTGADVYAKYMTDVIEILRTIR